MLVKGSRAPRFAVLFTICIALASAPAAGQPLPEILAHVYATNPTLLAARSELRATNERVPQALAGWRPTVSVTGSYGAVDALNRARAVGPDGTPFSIVQDQTQSPVTGALVFAQPLYRGGRTAAAVRRAENAVLAQRARLLEAEQQVLLDTVIAYVSVLRDRELLRLNTNNIAVLEQQQAGTARRLRAGEVTRTDQLQTETRLALAMVSRAAAERASEASRAAYARLVGGEPGILVPPQPLVPVVTARNAARQRAGEESPAVTAALFDAAAARDVVDIQFSQLLPQLSVQAQVYRSDNQGARGTRSEGQALTASVVIPLYQGGAEYAAVREARELAQRARAVLEQERRLAMQRGAEAWDSLVAARAQTEAVRRAIRAAEAALLGVQREALNGGRTTIEVLNAEVELLNGRTTLAQAAADVVIASYVLAAAVGRLTAQDLRLPVTPFDWTEHYRAVRGRWAGLGE
jgi:outer membrane protein